MRGGNVPKTPADAVTEKAGSRLVQKSESQERERGGERKGG